MARLSTHAGSKIVTEMRLLLRVVTSFGLKDNPMRISVIMTDRYFSEGNCVAFL